MFCYMYEIYGKEIRSSFLFDLNGRQNGPQISDCKQTNGIETIRVEFIGFPRFWLNQEENEESMNACSNGRHFHP